MLSDQMISKRAIGLLGLLSAAIPLLISCGSNNSTVADDGSNVVMRPPAEILRLRAVDTSNLSLEVLVDGNPVVMAEAADGSQWSGTIDLLPNVFYNVRITWIETFNGQALLLSRAFTRTQIESGEANPRIEIARSEFSGAAFDFDSDGRSNIDERTAGSDPTDPLSPEAPPQFVDVNLQLNIPSSFQAASVDSSDFVMRAFINNQSVDLIRNDLVWSGVSRLIENSDANIDARLYRDNSETVRIGDVLLTRNIGTGGLVVISDTDFNYQIDSDGDGLFNLDEILNGFDPLNSNSPVSNPCLPTPFVANCTNDEDNDGETDFQETEDADDDLDGIPNYLESNIVDADEDLAFAHEDANEDDPCIPNPSSFACLNMP